jgi:hypothetical protein
MKTYTPKEKGLILELSITTVEIIKLILIFFCLNYLKLNNVIILLILEFSICSYQNFDSDFKKNIAKNMKLSKIKFSKNSILYIFRSCIYVMCLILVFTKSETMTYISLILLVLSKAFFEQYLKFLNQNT